MKKQNRPTKRELKAESAPLTQGEQYQAAVRAVVWCSHILHHHDLPGLLMALEQARGIAFRAGTTGQYDKLVQDIATLKVGLPLWEHSKRVREGLARS